MRLLKHKVRRLGTSKEQQNKKTRHILQSKKTQFILYTEQGL